MDEVEHTFRRLRRLGLVDEFGLTRDGLLALIVLQTVVETFDVTFGGHVDTVEAMVDFKVGDKVLWHDKDEAGTPAHEGYVDGIDQGTDQWVYVRPGVGLATIPVGRHHVHLESGVDRCAFCVER